MRRPFLVMDGGQAYAIELSPSRYGHIDNVAFSFDRISFHTFATVAQTRHDLQRILRRICVRDNQVDALNIGGTLRVSWRRTATFKLGYIDMCWVVECDDRVERKCGERLLSGVLNHRLNVVEVVLDNGFGIILNLKTGRALPWSLNGLLSGNRNPREPNCQ